MSDSADKTLAILIKFGMEGDAAKQALAEINDLKPATEKLTEATNEGSKAAKLFGSEHKAVHQLMHEMKETAPLLGSALRLIFSPVVGTIAIATVALNYFKKGIEELNAELDKIQESARVPIDNVTEALEKARTETDKGREAFQKWNHGLNEDANSATDALDHELKKVEAVTKATLALLAAQEKAGLISPEHAEAARGAAEGHGAQEEIRLREQTRLTLERTLPGQMAATNRAEAAATDDQRNLRIELLNQRIASTKVEDYPNKLRDADAKVAEAQAKVAKEEAWVRAQGGDPEKQAGFSAYKRAVAAAEIPTSERAKLVATNEAHEKYLAQLERETKAKQDAATALENTQRIEESTRRQIKAIDSQLPDLKFKAGIEADTRLTTTVYEDIARNKKAGGDIHDSTSHNEAVAALKKSQADGRALAVAAKEAAAAHSDSLGTITDAIKDLRRSNALLQDRINHGFSMSGQ